MISAKIAPVRLTGAYKTYAPSFQRKTEAIVNDLSYQNVLGKSLKSTPNNDFEERLAEFRGIGSLEKAKERTSNLSRYLKEEMVGFVVPEYEIQGEHKGGYQWFEKGAEYLLKGSKENASEKDYSVIAKELYGLLATHDNYFKSNDFSDYLSTLKPSPAILATQKAIKELQKDKTVSFNGMLQMWGYFSPLKAMEKLLKDGCAYTGESLTFDDPTKKHPQIEPFKNASLDHIMPKSWGGPCEDFNYILSSQESNSQRGNINLIKFIKGHDDTVHSH